MRNFRSDKVTQGKTAAGPRVDFLINSDSSVTYAFVGKTTEFRQDSRPGLEPISR